MALCTRAAATAGINAAGQACHRHLCVADLLADLRDLILDDGEASQLLPSPALVWEGLDELLAHQGA